MPVVYALSWTNIEADAGSADSGSCSKTTVPQRSPAPRPRNAFSPLFAAGLPAPEVNARILGHEVDFLWRDEGLVVEVDGFQFHSTRAAFERDRQRDAELQGAGLRVLRVTWRQVVDAPYAALTNLVRALGI
jgi:hypothetical protein